MTITVHTDGASRGNPGAAAIAYVIDGLSAKIEHAETIGQTTNNQAEYQALVAALNAIDPVAVRGAMIECFADSELMVKQLNGEYRVKDELLRPHFAAIKQRVTELGKAEATVSFTAVRRADNQRADQLCNLALDGAL